MSDLYPKLYKIYTYDWELLYEGTSIPSDYSGGCYLLQTQVNNYGDDLLHFFYSGDIQDGLYSGDGIFIKCYRGGSMSELFVNGKFDFDKLISTDAEVLQEGTFENGKLTGYAVEKVFNWAGGPAKKVFRKYEGEFKAGCYSGQGTLYYTNYNAMYTFGMSHDPTKKSLINNAIEGIVCYEGEFVDQYKHGYGKLYTYPGMDLYYEGDFVKGSMHGRGKLYQSPGLLAYEGNWHYNKRDGFGKSYDYSGRIKKEGYWQNGYFKG